MRDLDVKIGGWRLRMAAGGIKSPAVLDELESHLREEIQERLIAGDSAAEAFEFAVARIGTAKSLRTEFNKVSGATSMPVVIGVGLWTAATILMMVVLSGRMIGGKLDFLLFVHILSLTTGYMAAFLCGGLGIVYVGWRTTGRLSSEREESLDKTASRFIYISGGLVIGGFLLGMVWGRQHFGTFWIGDRREIGCLCASVWAAALCLAHRFGRMSNDTRMFLCIMGNMIVGLGWFCAVIRGGISLGIVGNWPMEVFLSVHILSLVFAFSRPFKTVKS
jgi:hypothetical protein